MLRPSHVVQGSSFEGVAIPLIDRLYAAALRLTRSEHDAEDLVQETFLRTLEAFPRLDKTGNLRAYLFRVMTNIYINHYRHCQVAHRVAELASIGRLDESLYSSVCIAVWSDPDVRFEHSNLSREIEAALDALPERFRLVLLMADLMDFTYAEIAAEMSIPVGTVMSRLFRARRFVREKLLANSAAEVRGLLGEAKCA